MGFTDRLVDCFHAQVFIQFHTTGILLIRWYRLSLQLSHVSHAFFEFYGTHVGERKAHNDDCPSKVIRKIKALRQLRTNHSKEEGTGLAFSLRRAKNQWLACEMGTTNRPSP